MEQGSHPAEEESTRLQRVCKQWYAEHTHAQFTRNLSQIALKRFLSQGARQGWVYKSGSSAVRINGHIELDTQDCQY